MPGGCAVADGSAHADGLLVGLNDGDDAFLVPGIGLAGVLRRDLSMISQAASPSSHLVTRPRMMTGWNQLVVVGADEDRGGVG
jgi:hypothetical protein